MAAGSFVVAALAVAGAAAGSLSGIGAPPAPAASVVSCATEGSSAAADVVEGTRRASSPAVDRDETSDESDTLASRARERSGGGAASTDADGDTGGATADSEQGTGARGETGASEASAEELAQALADALAGSTNPAAQRIAEALADEGFVAAEQGGASDQETGRDETGQNESEAGAGAGLGNDTGTGRSNNGSDRTSNGLADNADDSDATQASNTSGRTGNGLADDEATCADSEEETGGAADSDAVRSTLEPEQESGRGGVAQDDADGSTGRTGSRTRADDERSSDGIASALDRTADTAAERGDGLQR